MTGTSTVTAPPPGFAIYQIKVSNQVVQDWPDHVWLTQKWGQHDVFEMHMTVPKMQPYKRQLVAWAKDAPVEIAWGRQPGDITTWYGYVGYHNLHTDDTNTGDSQMIHITYYCIGTSRVLDTDMQVTWQNVRPSDIAIRIAKKNGFRSV